ncbi:DoxX family protein [Methylovorus mays]|uniref:DoxX family protein n=1 Tax=Methylovorus mays TaxID=184077 RepID=UPI001E49C130|nr:DoxX family protein [Methylovorus mays]MCB5208262.1 DoxX family protein [Methylovorus mays]
MNPCNRWLTFAGRVLLSLIFIISGLGKVAAPDATIGYISSVGAPFPEVAYAIALLVELGLGLALLLGFKAKFAAAGIAIFTLAAAFMFHTDFSNQIQLVMFMKNFTIIGGLLLIVAHGAGGFSLDNRK